MRRACCNGRWDTARGGNENSRQTTFARTSGTLCALSSGMQTRPTRSASSLHSGVCAERLKSSQHRRARATFVCPKSMREHCGGARRARTARAVMKVSGRMSGAGARRILVWDGRAQPAPVGHTERPVAGRPQCDGRNSRFVYYLPLQHAYMRYKAVRYVTVCA